MPELRADSRAQHVELWRFIVVSMLLGAVFAVPASATATVPATAIGSSAGLVLPSETCRGLFILPVTVGGGEGATLDLLLDTGSSWTFIDPGAIRGIFGRQFGAGKVLFRNARIGRHEIGSLKALVYPMETLGLAIGRKIDGILGFPVFKDVLLTLDYPAEEIRISTGRLPRPDGREVFHATGSRRPNLKIDVGGRRVKILLDSGSTGRFTLRPADRLRWSVKPRPVSASVQFATVTVKNGGRLDNDLQFGPLVFEDPVVLLAGDDRLAGWHVLHHFVLTFDQKKKRIRMQPNDASPVRIASLVGPGLAVRPRPEGLEIISAFPGTSAEAAGLRQGDLVTAINGTPVYQRGCRDPRGDPANQRETWSYLRDGVRAEAEISTEILVP